MGTRHALSGVRDVPPHPLNILLRRHNVRSPTLLSFGNTWPWFVGGEKHVSGRKMKQARCLRNLPQIAPETRHSRCLSIQPSGDGTRLYPPARSSPTPPFSSPRHLAVIRTA